MTNHAGSCDFVLHSDAIEHVCTLQEAQLAYDTMHLTYTWSPCRYTGAWVDGHCCGQGTCVYANGDVYEVSAPNIAETCCLTSTLQSAPTINCNV